MGHTPRINYYQRISLEFSLLLKSILLNLKLILLDAKFKTNTLRILKSLSLEANVILDPPKYKPNEH